MDGEVDIKGEVFETLVIFFISHDQGSAYVDGDLDSNHGRAQEKLERWARHRIYYYLI